MTDLPLRTLIIIAVCLLVSLAALSWIYMALPSAPRPIAGEFACDADAKICPDGSAVGREGPNCEFAACPDESSGEIPVIAPGTKVTVSTGLGQGVVALGETITPRSVLEDSRCAIDLQCVWAGTVRVDGTALGGMGLGQLTFELGKTSSTEINLITLVAVEPYPLSGTKIADEDYVFTFEVERRSM